MKQQFVINHRYTVLQESEETLRVINRPTLRMSCFYENMRSRFFFCGHDILTGRVFVTQLSNIVVITVRRIVWVTANCCIMSQIWLTVQTCVCVCIYIYIYIYMCVCVCVHGSAVVIRTPAHLNVTGPQHDREEEQKDPTPA